MKALRKLTSGAEGVQLCEIPVPEPAADEIRIKVAYAGICGTDLHIIQDEYPAALPVTIGHEYSGIVDAVGTQVQNYAVGDRVTSMTVGYACGVCRCCRQGNELKCRERKSIGSGMDGSMAEYVTVKADRAFHIPDNVSLKTAALVEPVSCCTRAVVEVSAVRPGDRVYVSGPGIMGQLVAQLVKLAGAQVTLSGTERDSARLELAKRLSAAEVLNAAAPDFLGRAAEITKGEGYDVAFECAGVKPSADTCLQLLRPMGQYVQICLFGKPMLFDMDAALIEEKHIVNTFAAERSSFEITLRLMERGQLKLEEFVSGEYPLVQWRQAVDHALSKSGYKILLRPNEAQESM